MAAGLYVGSALFGAGIDGDLHVNANPFTVADPLNPSANLVIANVLQRHVALTSLTVDAGCVLDTYGYQIAVTGPFVNNGRVSCDGRPASGATGGQPGGFSSSLTIGTTGRTGTTGTGAAAYPYVYGGAGGAGGSGASGAGGAAGTPPVGQLKGAGPAAPLFFLTGSFSANANAGGGGAAGAGDGTNTGGGGGGGGGGVFLCASQFDNRNGVISANGGNGGTPAAGNCGGGGGGGGGFVLVCWVENPAALNLDHIGVDNLLTAIGGTCTAAGGAGGAGSGTGTAGQAGQDGRILAYIVPL